MAMIALMMEAVRTSETSIYLYETTQEAIILMLAAVVRTWNFT
jgi:hypothetical protein